MNVRSYTPGPPLSQFVHSFWLITSEPSPSLSTPQQISRILPRGVVELVFSFDRPTLSFSDGPSAVTETVRVPFWAGPYSKAFLIEPSEYTRVVGVRFRPGRARPFLPVPADALHNIDASWDLFSPSSAAEVTDRLRMARTSEALFQTLAGILLQKLYRSAEAVPPPAMDYAVRQFLSMPSQQPIAAVQEKTGLSHTRFNQLFREHVGLRPGLFCRIRRFQYLLQHLRPGQTAHWADLAAQCGYFDQAHLIRDFRALSGLTPGAYLRSMSPPERQSVQYEAAVLA